MHGLPSDLTLRVGMHAGPVLVGWDPVVRQMNYFGPHVLYAQLIEPITTPGCAFATAQFAACLATSPDSHEFRLEYIGSSVLEKEFADQDYAQLSMKEKQDYARCDLYNLLENKQFSSTRVLVNETNMMQQHAFHRTSEDGTGGAGGGGVGVGIDVGGPTDHLVSPSITYSLLKIEEIKTERENQQHMMELEAEKKLGEANGLSTQSTSSSATLPFTPDLSRHRLQAHNTIDKPPNALDM